jgi:hypothetical protein
VISLTNGLATSTSIPVGIYDVQLFINAITNTGGTPSWNIVLTAIAGGAQRTIPLNGVANYQDAIVKILTPSTISLTSSKTITAIDANLELLKLR